jgi:glycosyltransferase involved in cell wall biosynthesis
MPQISIIIPVFNVENYLADCLHSVCSQTFSDLEIICIEDGSTDGSYQKLKQLASADSRITVFRHGENKGLAAARNTGIRHASSPWILFVDSDDVVAPKMCEEVLLAARKHGSDFLTYRHVAFPDGRTVPCSSGSGRVHEVTPMELLRMPAFAWTKFVKRTLFTEKNIWFPEGLDLEDTLVHWKLSLESEKPVLLDLILVFYRQRNSSVCYRKDWSRADSILVYDLVGSYLEESGRIERWKVTFYEKVLANFASLHAHYTTANPLLVPRVAEEARRRMTDQHWQVLCETDELLGWQRDYLIANCIPVKHGRGVAWAKARAFQWTRDVVRRLRH